MIIEKTKRKQCTECGHTLVPKTTIKTICDWCKYEESREAGKEYKKHFIDVTAFWKHRLRDLDFDKTTKEYQVCSWECYFHLLEMLVKKRNLSFVSHELIQKEHLPGFIRAVKKYRG